MKEGHYRDEVSFFYVWSMDSQVSVRRWLFSLSFHTVWLRWIVFGV